MGTLQVPRSGPNNGPSTFATLNSVITFNLASVAIFLSLSKCYQ